MTKLYYISLELGWETFLKKEMWFSQERSKTKKRKEKKFDYWLDNFLCKMRYDDIIS